MLSVKWLFESYSIKIEIKTVPKNHFFITQSSSRLQGCFGIRKEFVRRLRHWSFWRSTTSDYCLLWYGNGRWRLDGKICTIYQSLSLFLPLFLSPSRSNHPSVRLPVFLFLAFFHSLAFFISLCLSMHYF